MLQFLTVLLYIVLSLTSLFLICLVLIQRGKGGGLAGAFGGAGGSSAFGTKAGDVFTRVTMYSAAVWIALNMVLVVVSGNRTSAWGPAPAKADKSEVKTSETVPLQPGESTRIETTPPSIKIDSGAKSDTVIPGSGASPSTPPAIPESPKKSETVAPPSGAVPSTPPALPDDPFKPSPKS